LAKAQSSFFGVFVGSIDHLMLIKCISVGSIFLFNFVGKNLQSFTKKLLIRLHQALDALCVF
jgi:hypothetical protein